MITVITAPEATRLTTVANLRLAMGAEGDTIALELAEQLIDDASGLIAGYLGYELGRAALRESIRPNPLDHRIRPVVLERFPVAALTSLTADGTVLTEDTDFEVDYLAGMIHRLSSNDYASWHTYTKLTVLYSSGWLLPEETGRTLPRDIEVCTVDLCRHINASRSRDPLLRSQSILNGLVAESFHAPSSRGEGIHRIDRSLPEEIVHRLAPYRVHRL